MKEQSCVIRKDIAEVVGMLSYCEGYTYVSQRFALLDL